MFRRIIMVKPRPPSPYTTIKPFHTHGSPHLSLLADKCTSMHQLKQIHAQMLTSSTFHDNFAASRLLAFSALSPNGDINYAKKLFKSTQKPNMFMWNTLIRGLTINNVPYEAILVYVEMCVEGVRPGKHTFAFLIKACASLRSRKMCEAVHGCVVKYGLEYDLHVVNNLVRGYSVCGAVEFARQVFDEFGGRDVNVWTTMVCGYTQNDFAKEAVDLFSEMVDQGFKPSGPCLSSVLSACAQSGCLDMGEKVHRYIKEKGFDTGVILGTALVDMYAKNGELVMARSCFDKMESKNIVTWNAMISGLAVHGHAKEAVELFRELKNHHVVPNDSTFVGVLSACCHGGMFDYGREIFNSMKSVYDIEPKIQHYGCMVDLLGRSGEVVEAEELIKSMPRKADLKLLGALLSACANYENIEVAERVVKEMLVLDPDNHGVYVVLSNMYADAGRWEDVSRLRVIMKEGSLKKTPGSSLVDSLAPE